jgi:chromate transporter
MLWQLFITFAQIGLFAFGGGYAVLPFIQDYVVDRQGWLTLQELTDLVSLSQVTPGPIAINAATFIGTKVAGIPGAIVATLGNVTPQFIIMMILSSFLFSGKKASFIDRILAGLKPAIVGLIAIATLAMIQSSLFAGSWDPKAISWLALIGFVIGLVFYGRKKLSVIQLVLLSAGLGLAFHALALALA